MNIFLIGWNDEHPELVNVAKVLRERGNVITYWLGERDKFSRFAHEFPGTIFHDYRDAFALIAPREVDQSGFLPPGKDMLRKLYETESILMTMMNKHYPHLGVSERKHIYYQLLRYWDGVIERYKPGVIIFPMAPHTAPDFVAYNLAKLKGIKTVMFYMIDVSDRMLLIRDFAHGSAALRYEAESARGKQCALRDLAPDLRTHYEAFAQGKYMTPLSIALFRKQYAGVRLLRVKLAVFWTSITDGSFPKKFLRYIARPFIDNAKKEYQRVARSADLTEKFVYFPLHYQPEATTSPLADVFVDQLLAVETLAAALPDGWLLYVKEHPTQWVRRTPAYSSYRYKGYYDAMAKLSNVRLVPLKTPTYDLINAAQAIATDTGTAGWEAVLKFKPALAFGYPWYASAPGVFSVSDVQSCKEAFKKIMNGYRATEQEIINFIFALDKATIHGYLESHTKQFTTLDPEAARKSIAEALLTAIES